MDSKPLLQERPPAYSPAAQGAGYDYGQSNYGAIPPPQPGFQPPPPYPYPGAAAAAGGSEGWGARGAGGAAEREPRSLPRDGAARTGCGGRRWRGRGRRPAAGSGSGRGLRGRPAGAGTPGAAARSPAGSCSRLPRLSPARGGGCAGAGGLEAPPPLPLRPGCLRELAAVVVPQNRDSGSGRAAMAGKHPELAHADAAVPW